MLLNKWESIAILESLLKVCFNMVFNRVVNLDPLIIVLKKTNLDST